MCCYMDDILQKKNKKREKTKLFPSLFRKF